MSQQIYKARSNQSNLLKKLKLDNINPIQQSQQNKNKKKYSQSNYQTTLELESLTSQTKQNTNIIKQNPNIVKQNPITNPNYNRKQKKNNKKNKQTKKQQKQINIDSELGQAAQWMQKGTKDVEDDFQTNQNNMNTINNQMSKRMNEKANSIASGNYKQKNTNPTSLKQKAQMIRRQRQKEQQQKKNQNIQINRKSQQKIINQAKNNLIKSQEEGQDDPWNKINKQTLNIKKQNVIKKEYTKEQVINNYLKLNLQAQIRLIKLQIDQQVEEKTCVQKFLQIFSSKKQFNQSLKLQLLGLTKIFIKQDLDQFVLQSIWKTLTQKKFIRFGNHWQQIGFQGRDPQTDLRASGILSLFQIYLFMNKHPSYFKQIFKLSRDELYGFPFAISCIKISGKFIKLAKINKISGLQLNQYQDWYNCIFYEVFESLKDKKLDVMEFGMSMTQKLENIDGYLPKIHKNYKAKYNQIL